MSIGNIIVDIIESSCNSLFNEFSDGLIDGLIILELKRAAIMWSVHASAFVATPEGVVV